MEAVYGCIDLYLGIFIFIPYLGWYSEVYRVFDKNVFQ